MAIIKNIIITCEHGGNQVPIRYRTLFDEASLQKNNAWDEGALDLALSLAEKMDVPCFTHQTSRLLVDVDLLLGSESLFSLNTSLLGDADRQSILERYYFPYRQRIENTIAMSDKPLLHVSMHTSATQGADVVIVFNSERMLEKECLGVLMEALQHLPDNLQVAFQDIAGIHDVGFVQYLRTRFDEEAYAGLTLVIRPRPTNDESIIMLSEQLSKALSLLRS